MSEEYKTEMEEADQRIARVIVGDWFRYQVSDSTCAQTTVWEALRLEDAIGHALQYRGKYPKKGQEK